MCVEISGRVWGSIDFWSCEMTSLFLYHRVYVWFPGRKHRTSIVKCYSTAPPVKTFLLYIVHVSRIVLFVYVKVSVAVVAHHWAARSDCNKCRNKGRWLTVTFGEGGPCGGNLSCLQMWPAAGIGRSQTDTRRWSKDVAMSVSPH